ncbi:nuclear transport factor 2 family protein [Mucilaginibacter sp. UR6-11]|uniref:nuclear transport factor 2 family protein n=1 Tax=Mucilaginibacter sp. UR6-11 TaxID=1435644 RepID=UPI001E55C32D|nr:nuclear transport factor 2 family protein [Mucilaginibacter sp. UR6-11]MCC8424783.1 nuclear transport factor 2 family protein [Mucilaginibacter sp. UR6-11]
MKKIALATISFICYAAIAAAQVPARVSKVVEAEDAFNKLVARKGIKAGFLAVADPEGIVFRPKVVKIADFYNSVEKQPGTLQWEPKFARISYNGDLAFTAGPYVYLNGKNEDDKVYGDYVSIWRADADGKMKLLIDLGIQHPEMEKEATVDFKEPDATKKPVVNKDPFNGKNIIIATDKSLNQALTLSSLGAYKEFLSPEGRYYFPGFEPMTGTDKILKFLNNEAISISAENISGGRSTSNDLAYTYGRARIKKGNIVSNYNYVRIWELDASHKWDILLEVFSAIEN